MAVGATLHLEGMKELQRQLRRYSTEGLAASKKATGKAMTPVRKDAKVRAKQVSKSAPWPNSGALAEAMSKKSKSYKNRQTALTMVGANVNTVGTPPSPGQPIRKPKWYLHLVLLGTKSHKQPNSMWGPSFIHPGAKPQPFLYDALKSNSTKVLNIYADEINRWLHMVART